MKEDFLQFIWQYRLYDSDHLKTVDGKSLIILSPGTPNTDSGPDFFNARIKIENTIWAGNVEVHQKSSFWHLHNHQNDQAYNNVILHVVEFFDDQVIINGDELPTLVMKYPKALLDNFENLLKSKQWIACEDKIPRIDPFTLRFWYSSLMAERLQSKTADIQAILAQNKSNWNETFYQLLARNFGMKTNALPFELLAKSLPLQVLSKHKNSLFQIEALLFGQSGLLNETLLGDDYYLSLRKEYSYLYKKYNLKGIESHLWKFMRLRPVNFPTLRIAQLAKLIHSSSWLFSKVRETDELEKLQELFDVSASEYWDNHYQFNKISEEKKEKHLGQVAFNNIVINTIAPMLFVYGEYQGDQSLKDKVFNWIEELPPEHNQITNKWIELGIKCRSAFETQALIQLKNKYCDAKKCLHCQVGAKIITSTTFGHD